MPGQKKGLGKHGSDASRRKYDRIIAEFVANGRQAFFAPDEIPIESLIVRYLDYASRELDYSPGRKDRLKRLMRRLNHLYGQQPVSAFGPSALKTLRQGFVDEGFARDTVNAYIASIRQVFYWGAEEEIIPADIAAALRRDAKRQVYRIGLLTSCDTRRGRKFGISLDWNMPRQCWGIPMPRPRRSMPKCPLIKPRK